MGVRSGATVIVLALLIYLSIPAIAHQPSSQGWDWTCSGGDGTLMIAGTCRSMTQSNPPAHHNYADAHFYYTSSLGGSWVTPVNTGYLAWDRTNGHQFNYIKQTSDNSYNASVSVVTGTTCGDPSNFGCTNAGLSGSHMNNATATIKFKSTLSYGNRANVAAHEFGHLLALGHSDVSYATMYPSVGSGASTLASPDRLGRCQVYGHAHGWWGGC